MKPSALAIQKPGLAPSDLPTLRPIERVAVILSLLETDQARAIAEQLDEGAVDRIIEAYERLRTVPKPALLKIIAGFVTEVRSPHPRVRGGARKAAALAEALAPPELEPIPMATAMIDMPGTSGGSLAEGADPDAVWQFVKGMDATELAGLLAGERPAVTAAVLARLDADKAGPVMAALPPAAAIAVTRQMAQGGPVSATTMAAIAETLRREVVRKEETTDREEVPDALPHLTAILNRCPLSRQVLVLDPLREDANEHVEAVEQGLLRFPRLQDVLPRTAVPLLFREMPEAELDPAIRFGAQNAAEAVDYLYGNISQRLAQQIRERIEARPMPDEAEGERAQTAVIATILKWADEERFALDL
jgi:flagellar motor switch protein FliG